MTPEKVASVIYKSATVLNPRTTYRIGALAKITQKLRRLFGDNGWDKFMLKQIGISKKNQKMINFFYKIYPLKPQIKKM